MMRSLVFLSAAAATVMAGGYAIPENSINATALSAAYVANAHGADAAYYNPAAMVYNDDANLLEVDATYIGLSPIDFSGTTGNYSSKRENFIVPTMHFSSKKLGASGARAGFSVVVPAGLSKRWESAVPKASAEEFTLQTVELNPSLAIPLSDTLSMGLGFRLISSSGIVKSTYTVSRDMEGSSTDYGYNLALMYKSSSALNLAATYRSNVNLSVEGNAKLYYTTNLMYNGAAGVTVPMPAALNLAAAYTFDTGTTVEAVYEKTYWSAYKSLDFSYPTSIGILAPYFDAPKAKSWVDTSSYRLGLTQKYSQWTAMAGIAYDETPVPNATLGYELPDSNAWIVSLGGRYQLDSHWNLGLAGLVDMKKSREVNTNINGINGEFTNARAYLVTAGIEYRF
jgi:long-chain fatty acid transport protein